MDEIRRLGSAYEVAHAICLMYSRHLVRSQDVDGHPLGCISWHRSNYAVPFCIHNEIE